MPTRSTPEFGTRSSIVVRCRPRSGGNLVAQSEREQRQHANVGGGEPPELCGAPVRQLHGAWHERARVVHCRGGKSRLDAQGVHRGCSRARPLLARRVAFSCARRPSWQDDRQDVGQYSLITPCGYRAGPRLGRRPAARPPRCGPSAAASPARRPAAAAACRAARPAAGAPLPLSRGRAARLPGWQPSARSPEPRCPVSARPPAAKLPGPRQPGCPAGSRAARPVGRDTRAPRRQNQVSTRAPGEWPFSTVAFHTVRLVRAIVFSNKVHLPLNTQKIHTQKRSATTDPNQQSYN